MTKTAEEVFIENTKRGMIEFGIEGFKRTHPHLFRVILASITDYHDQFKTPPALSEEIREVLEIVRPTIMREVDLKGLSPSILEKLDTALSLPSVKNDAVEEENTELKKALDLLLNNDYGSGCPMCDSGILRDKTKQHWDDCNWNNARIIYEKLKSN